MRPLKLIAGLALAGAAMSAEQASYALRPSEGAAMELTVEKTGLLKGKKHLFVFSEYQGILRLDSEKPERSEVDLTINSASLTCNDVWLSAKDLRKVQDYALNDMLAAKRYPSMRFRSSGIRQAEGGAYEIQGQLTIRDVSKPVTLHAKMRSRGPEFLVEGSAILKLSDFGLKPATAALGLIGTKDEMNFHFNILATPGGSE
jgi:polyisoprenoid-binding protein YceI